MYLCIILCIYCHTNKIETDVYYPCLTEHIYFRYVYSFWFNNSANMANIGTSTLEVHYTSIPYQQLIWEVVRYGVISGPL